MPEFSQNEWDLLYEACRGWGTQIEPTEHLLPELAEQVSDIITMEQIDKRWSVDASALLSRLKQLSAVETIAVVHAIERW